MKNIAILIIVFFTTSIFAQTHEILKHNSEKLDANYINTDSNLIYYSLSSSSEKQKISKFAVAQINEKSIADAIRHHLSNSRPCQRGLQIPGPL